MGQPERSGQHPRGASATRRSLLGALCLVTLAAGACEGAQDGAPVREGGAQIGQGDAPTRTPTLTGTGGINDPSRLDAPYVVLVALDGFRHDYLELYDAPNLRALAARGVRADGLIPPLPSKTFPSFYTLATGVRPGRHGIVSNSFWDPERGERYAMGDRATVQDGTWYGAEPIWVTAETQGTVAGSYFWVGTEAPVRGVQPTFWKPFEEGVPHDARVDSVLSWLALPPENRAHLAGLYFNDTDDAGHFYGPESAETAAAVATMDDAMGRLLRGLDALGHGDEIHVVVVSDHGIAPVSADDVQRIDPDLYEGVRFDGASEYVTATMEGGIEERREMRDRLRADFPRVDVQLVDDLPEPHDLSLSPRAGDLVLLPDLGVRIVFGDRPVPDRSGGHGWDPKYREMHGIFLAAGPRILEGQSVPALEAVDVYPFVAELLELRPAEVEGRLDALRSVLRPAPAR